MAIKIGKVYFIISMLIKFKKQQLISYLRRKVQFKSQCRLTNLSCSFIRKLVSRHWLWNSLQ